MRGSGNKKPAVRIARRVARAVLTISVVGVLVGLALSANGSVGDPGGA
jgi:hypothetical protein